MRLMFLSAGRYSPKGMAAIMYSSPAKSSFCSRKPWFSHTVTAIDSLREQFPVPEASVQGWLSYMTKVRYPRRNFVPCSCCEAAQQNSSFLRAILGASALNAVCCIPVISLLKLSELSAGMGSIWSVKAKGEHICCKLEPKRSPISRLAFTDVMDRG